MIDTHASRIMLSAEESEIKSGKREIHYVDQKRLATNIAICLPNVFGSAIKWSIKYARENALQ